jgi:hypothetical protein
MAKVLLMRKNTVRTPARREMMQRAWYQPMNPRRLPLAGVIGAAVAVAADLGIREAGERWLDVPPEQSVLSTTSIVVATVVAAFPATVLLAVLGQTQARPFSVFRRLALVVFLVSCLGPLFARLGWLPNVPQIDGDTFLVLMLMNVATAIILVTFLTTLPRRRESGAGY